MNEAASYRDLNDDLNSHSNSHGKGSLAEVVILEKLRVCQSSNSCSRSWLASGMANRQLGTPK